MYHDADFSIIPHLLSDSPICIDVGANAGQSICSLKMARPGAVIHSFEPNPEYREVLSGFENSFEDVHIYDVGLGSKELLIDFYIPVVNGVRYPEGTTMRLEALNEPWVVERYIQLGGRHLLRSSHVKF